METIRDLLSAIRSITSTSTSTSSSAQGETNSEGGVICTTAGDKEDSSISMMREKETEGFWAEADADGDRRVAYEEILRICRRMGIVVVGGGGEIIRRCRVSKIGFNTIISLRSG